MSLKLIAVTALWATGAAAGAAPCFQVSADGSAFTKLEGYSLQDEAGAPGLMARPPIAGDASGLLCMRESVTPQGDDFEALYYAPLYLATDGGETVLALGHGEGRYLYRLVRGEIDDSERAAIREAVTGFNEAEAALREADGGRPAADG